jgi:hypothetical protein
MSDRKVLERDFLAELYEQEVLRPNGWLYADDDPLGEGHYRHLQQRRSGEFPSWITEDLCLACGEFRTPELHDPCIANLPGVLFACCGHGRKSGCYVVGSPFGKLEGPAAARKMKELGGRPPTRAFLLDPVRGAA